MVCWYLFRLWSDFMSTAAAAVGCGVSNEVEVQFGFPDIESEDS